MKDDTVSARQVQASPVRAVAMFASGLVLLALLVWLVDPSRVASVLRNADLMWLCLAVLAITGATLLGAINSYIMAAPGLGLRFRSFLGAYWGAWALGQVMPGQVGDLVGVSLYLRQRGLSLPVAVGRLGVDKLISLFCTLVLSTGLIAIYDAPAAQLAGALGACAAAGLLIAYAFSLRWRGDSVRAGRYATYLLTSLREAHLVIATRPRAVAANALLTLLKLLVIGTGYWTMLRALDASPGNLVDVTITANSAGLIAYVPLSANGVGTVEAGGLYLFGLRGLTAPVIVATYLTLRLANLVLAWAGTAFIIMFSTWCARRGNE